MELPRRVVLFASGLVVAAAVGLAVAIHPVLGIGVIVLALSCLVLSGRLWPDLGRRRTVLTVATALGLSFVALFPAGLYVYVVTISAGLCGERTGYASVASVVAYGVVASRGLRSPKQLVLFWPLAILAAVAVWLLVDYPFSSAHGYCET